MKRRRTPFATSLILNVYLGMLEVFFVKFLGYYLTRRCAAASLWHTLRFIALVFDDYLAHRLSALQAGVSLAHFFQ